MGSSKSKSEQLLEDVANIQASVMTQTAQRLEQSSSTVNSIRIGNVSGSRIQNVGILNSLSL